MSALEHAYRAVFRTTLSRMDPEHAHHLAMLAIRALGAEPVRGPVGRITAPAPGRAVSAMGLEFSSPFGLAAGFDKNAVGVAGLGALGFGHVEVGTVTRLPQPGNPRPRLHRLPRDGALINRMGFNNDGAEAVSKRLARLRRRGGLPVIGVNIGKSRAVEVEDAVADYVASARLLAPVADYLAVNVSSPNTPGLRGLQEPERLRPLLEAVRTASAGVPLLVKIAPDLDDDAIGDVAALATDVGLAGVIATNTTVARPTLRTPAAAVRAMGEGGLSGPPVGARSVEVLRLLKRALPTEAVVVSAGGVATAADVRARLAGGAALVQGYTAFLYRGPGWAAELSAA